MCYILLSLQMILAIAHTHLYPLKIAVSQGD